MESLLKRDKLESEKPLEREQDTATWYHEGPETLRIARQAILGIFFK